MPRLEAEGGARQASERKTPRAPRATSRRTRQETTEAILDAAEQLFSERNPMSVTVREVAERAGVTHALVHQYVGSKDDLFNAVVQRVAPDRQLIIRASPSYREAIAALVPDVLDRRLHSLTMVRSAMDGIEYLSLKERIATGQMLIDAARRAIADGEKRPSASPQIDPRVDVAALIALSFGWVALEAWLTAICGLDDEDPEFVRAEFTRVCESVAELALPPADEPST